MDGPLLAVAFGWILGLGSQIVSSRLERKKRREERAEVAAEELLTLLNRVRQLFRPAYKNTSDVDHKRLWALTGKIRQLSALLDDPTRDRMRLVTEVLEDFHGAQQFTGGPSPSTISRCACAEGDEVLRCLLRGETLPPTDPKLLEYKQSIEEHRALQNESFATHSE